MALLLLIVAASVATFTFFYFAHQSAHAQRPAKPRRQYHLEASSWRERLLLVSPVPCALVALIVFSVPPLDRLGPASLAIVLDRVCSYSLPTLWCWKVPKPAPWILVIHAAIYLWFLGMSAYLVFSIMTGRIPKPRRYVEGSFPLSLSLACAGLWLFIVAGGQFFAQTRLGYFIPYLGLFLCVAFLCLALSALYTIAITLKYRRPPIST